LSSVNPSSRRKLRCPSKPGSSLLDPVRIRTSREKVFVTDTQVLDNTVSTFLLACSLSRYAGVRMPRAQNQAIKSWMFDARMQDVVCHTEQAYAMHNGDRVVMKADTQDSRHCVLLMLFDRSPSQQRADVKVAMSLPDDSVHKRERVRQLGPLSYGIRHSSLVRCRTHVPSASAGSNVSSSATILVVRQDR
jgi:hypothetical protein